jgi:membrane-associated phospholipid phosphatase
MAVGSILTIAFSVMGYLFCDLTLGVDQAAPLAMTMAILLIVAAQYRYRKEQNCFQVVMMTFWIVAITNLHFFPMYMAAGRDVPISDAWLAGMDRGLLGFEVPDVMSALQPYPRFNLFMLRIYESLLYLMTVATILPPILNRMEYAKEYAIGCVVAAVISMPIFALFQAVGPWDYYGFAPAIPSLNDKWPIMELVKTDSTFVIDITNRDGLITFPSFHVILTVLAAITLRSFRYLRWCVAFWAVLIVISTVTTGIHYSIDVIGGLVIAAISWFAARALLRVEHRLNSAWVGPDAA